MWWNAIRWAHRLGPCSTVKPAAAKTAGDVGHPKTPPRAAVIWPVVDRAITLHNL